MIICVSSSLINLYTCAKCAHHSIMTHKICVVVWCNAQHLRKLFMLENRSMHAFWSMFSARHCQTCQRGVWMSHGHPQVVRSLLPVSFYVVDVPFPNPCSIIAMNKKYRDPALAIIIGVYLPSWHSLLRVFQCSMGIYSICLHVKGNLNFESIHTQ